MTAVTTNRRLMSLPTICVPPRSDRRRLVTTMRTLSPR